MGSYHYAWCSTDMNEWKYSTVNGTSRPTAMGIFLDTWYECIYSGRYTIGLKENDNR